MKIQQIKEYLYLSSISYEENVDLKKKTWIRRGGIADIFILPKDSLELRNVVSYLYKNTIEFKLIGHTSNLYILNETNIPVVVSTLKCNHYDVEDDTVYCEAGASVIKLSNDMVAKGVKGFEYLTGLPGTIAAALVNNSSCKENSISDLLLSAEVVLENGETKVFLPEDFRFSFRTSVFKEKRIKGTIISAKLKVTYSNPAVLKSIADYNSIDRKNRLDWHSKNLGCTVHRTFSLGRMPLKYYVLSRLIKVWTLITRRTNEYYNDTTNRILCNLSGCKEAYPYISKKNTIVFLWLDEGADKAFPVYLKYMEKVYRTNKIEIEIL